MLGEGLIFIFPQLVVSKLKKWLFIWIESSSNLIHRLNKHHTCETTKAKGSFLAQPNKPN